MFRRSLSSTGSKMKLVQRLVMIGFAAHLGGCASTVPVSYTSVEQSSVLRHINQEGAKRRSTIQADGATIRAARLEVGSSALLIRTVTGDSLTVPAHDVRGIEFGYAGAGAVDGMAMGGLVAVGAGLAAALLMTPGGGDPSPLDSRAFVGIVIGIATGAVSIPLGALIGAVVGHRIRYDFTPRQR